MSTTKVLHVIARMNVGGTARYVGELVKNIPDSFLATGYIQGAELEDPIISTLDAYRLPHMGRKLSPVNDFRAWVELRALVRQLKPEIVHTHTFKAGLIGRLIGGNHKRVHTFHGHLFGDQSFSPIEKKLIAISEKYLSKKSDVLISVGEKVGNELRAAGIGLKTEWASIPPGILPLPKIPKTDARRLLNLDQDELIVGWMARMTEVKNPHLLLELAKRMPSTKFVMAGGGNLFQEINALAPANLRILGWADASIFWSAVDIAISTSDNEGMPVALIEAQMAGIPVLATNVGSNSEVVENGVTGLVIPKSVHDLEEALSELISPKNQSISIGKLISELTVSKFNLQVMLARHAQIYEKISSVD